MVTHLARTSFIVILRREGFFQPCCGSADIGQYWRVVAPSQVEWSVHTSLDVIWLTMMAGICVSLQFRPSSGSTVTFETFEGFSDTAFGRQKLTRDERSIVEIERPRRWLCDTAFFGGQLRPLASDVCYHVPSLEVDIFKAGHCGIYPRIGALTLRRVDCVGCKASYRSAMVSRTNWVRRSLMLAFQLQED